MLQLQLDANKAAGHPVISKMSLDQFAQWIVQFEQLTVKGSGLIESLLIKGLAKVSVAQSIEELDIIKNDLAR